MDRLKKSEEQKAVSRACSEYNGKSPCQGLLAEPDIKEALRMSQRLRNLTTQNTLKTHRLIKFQTSP